MGQHPRVIARVALDAERLALAALVHQVEGAVALVPKSTSPAWRGPASAAFGAALTTLRRELNDAADLLRAAERLTVTAMNELDSNG